MISKKENVKIQKCLFYAELSLMLAGIALCSISMHESKSWVVKTALIICSVMIFLNSGSIFLRLDKEKEN